MRLSGDFQFGNQPVGSQSCQTIRFENVTSQTIEVDYTFFGSPTTFSFGGDPNFNTCAGLPGCEFLAPGEQCAVPFAFTPTENRQYTGEFCVFVGSDSRCKTLRGKGDG